MQHFNALNTTAGPQGIFFSNQTAIPYLISQENYNFTVPSGITTSSTAAAAAAAAKPNKPQSRTRTATAVPLTNINSPTVNWDSPRNRERMLRLILSVSVSGDKPLYKADADAFVAGYRRHQAFRNGAHEMLVHLLRKERDAKYGEEISGVDRERVRVLRELIGKAGGKAAVERLLRDEDDLVKGRGRVQVGGVDLRVVRQQLGL